MFLTSCTFSGLLIFVPRRAPPLLVPSEADAIENRLSSSFISISGGLTQECLPKSY